MAIQALYNDVLYIQIGFAAIINKFLYVSKGTLGG